MTGGDIIIILFLVIAIFQNCKLQSAIISIKTKIKQIMTDLSALIQNVQATLAVEESAITLIQGLKAQLDAAGTDPVALKQLSDSLATEQQKLAAAILANTAPIASEEAPSTEDEVPSV